MQTFLPFPDCRESALVLDNQRLGKQRVECLQLINSLCGVRGSAGQQVPVGPNDRTWINHPAAQMWKDHLPALSFYAIVICKTWRGRGFNDSLLPHFNEFLQIYLNNSGRIEWPDWWGDPDLHRSHRSNLLRKNPAHYGPLFEKDLNPKLEYIWPT